MTDHPLLMFCSRLAGDEQLVQDWLGGLTLNPALNFARPGLARFVDHPHPHPDPRLRRAALYDPEAGPDLVVRLIDDPDAEVARWALRDPPTAPPEELHRRLAVPASARDAAANPALPPETMHRLLDLAGVANPQGTGTGTGTH